MKRSVILWFFSALMILAFLLTGPATAMAGTKKHGLPSESHRHIKVTKTGKPPAPKYVPKAKPAKGHKVQTGKDLGKTKKA